MPERPFEVHYAGHAQGVQVGLDVVFGAVARTFQRVKQGAECGGGAGLQEGFNGRGPWWCGDTRR